ncbi:cyclic pyranopterin monophosphate synthase MoaC [Alicyclobacillus mengziensis]|uniref:Cyclic pyranopterin monophosphate synthase n=1 Tax=Alicyclobacillus mengziensis TaxID=2931921 RepID=A0A9X7Z8R1_9BACL|nr:cyclic pyranopterin monophosphate synthase MoaC [Alicyclobacillus mengziensis]QSO49892.1 cyclic pyranopterin monophosphate synthase MoaC [Alicyclobacillus mengziensis]
MPESQETGFTHFDETGKSHMVDVSDKAESNREATAEAFVRMHSQTRLQIEQQAMKKGDVLAVSELAGIMAAKRTADLIPLCHPLPLTKVSVHSSWVDGDDMHAHLLDAADDHHESAYLRLRATVKTTSRTGVEMEALTACSIAALTVYDMCKAIDKDMTIEQVRLVHKAGGRSGTYERKI